MKIASTLTVCLLFAALPLATAAEFGSQVSSGSSDFVPTSATASVALSVLRKELGLANDITDDGLYLDTDASGTVTNFDIRLVGYGGKAAGTLITDSDTAEKGAASLGGATAAGYALAAISANFVRTDDSDSSKDLTDGYYVKGTGNTLAFVEDGDFRIFEPSALTDGAAVANGDADDDLDLVGLAILWEDVGASTTVTVGDEFWFDADSSGDVTNNDVRLTAQRTYAAGTLVDCTNVDTTLQDNDCVTYTGAPPAKPVLAALPGTAAGASTKAAPVWGTDSFYIDVDGNGISNKDDFRIDDGAGGLADEALVLATDSDAAHALVDASTFIEFYDFDTGTAGESTGDYFYKDVDGDDRVSTGDLRVQGAIAAGVATRGSTVAAGDADATAVTLDTSRIVYADVNNNGRYDQGDYVYWTTSTTGLAATTGLAGSIRLTSAGQAAGTFVYSSDSDYTAYNAAVTALTSSIAWHDADSSAGGAYTTGDLAYLVPQAVGALAAGSTFPLHSIRMDAPSFGSQLTASSSSTVPTTEAAAVNLMPGVAAGGNRVLRLEFGAVNDVNDDCIVLKTGAAGTTPANNDLRWTPCQGKSVGTVIADSDTTEKGAATVGNSQVAGTANHVVFADVNNNGRYDGGDHVYYIRNADGVATTTLKAPSGIGTAAETYTLRLAAAGGKSAGTFVLSGDPDFTSYQNAVLPLPGGASSVYYDADASNAFTASDRAYIVAADPTAAPMNAPGALFPIHSLRISSGNPGGGFGTHIGQGDSDFTGVSATGSAHPVDPEAVNAFIRLNMGAPNDINDDCIVLNLAPAAATVDNHDVRMTSCSGKSPGSLVSDSDTIEKAATPIASNANTRVVFADVNSNGRYDLGDYVYVVVQEGTSPASTALRAPDVDATTTDNGYTLRLRPAGGQPAGSIVFAGDSDFTTYGASTLALGGGANAITWFDADLSTNGAFTAGDSLYLAPSAVPDGVVFPQYAVRLGGPEITATPGVTPPAAPPATPPATPPTTPPATPSTPPGTPPATPNPTPPSTPPAGDVGTESDSEDDTETPGLGLMAILAALGAALMVRRR